MEEIVFGKGQDHMHREKTGLSKAGDQKMLVLKVCITLFFEEESLLHMRTNIKKKVHTGRGLEGNLLGA